MASPVFNLGRSLGVVTGQECHTVSFNYKAGGECGEQTGRIPETAAGSVGLIASIPHPPAALVCTSVYVLILAMCLSFL